MGLSCAGASPVPVRPERVLRQNGTERSGADSDSASPGADADVGAATCGTAAGSTIRSASARISETRPGASAACPAAARGGAVKWDQSQISPLASSKTTTSERNISVRVDNAGFRTGFAGLSRRA